MAEIQGVFYGVRAPAQSQRSEQSGLFRVLTKGNPQYVHQQICGLSTLINILGCPNGPPPPSQDTCRSCTHRTGCL